MKQRIWKSIVSAAAGALAAWAVRAVVQKLEQNGQRKKLDRKLDHDLADSMDCSDPIATY